MKKIKGITVRRAKLDDTHALMSMAYAFFLEQMEAPEEEFNSKDVMGHIVNYITSPDADILLAENGQGPVGTVALGVGPAYYNHDKMIASDHHFWIEPEYRSSSVVKALVASAKDWASKKGTVWLRAKIVDGQRYKVKKLKGAE